MLIDFIEELKGYMTFKEKTEFLEILERYPKIKKQILKELDKRSKLYKKKYIKNLCYQKK